MHALCSHPKVGKYELADFAVLVSVPECPPFG